MIADYLQTGERNENCLLLLPTAGYLKNPRRSRQLMERKGLTIFIFILYF
jgi:hypothetical protein